MAEWRPIKALVPPDEFDTSDQYTTLAWRFTERRDGETAVFEVCGLRAFVQDCDGDQSWWTVRKGRRGPILAQGERSDGTHFFECLREAEGNLRRIIAERIAELRRLRPPSVLPLAEGGEG